MSSFLVYLELGVSHILDLQGYDHMLFLLALTAVFSIAEWKKLAILVTAFTVGHTLTLLMAGRNVISLSAELVEVLIAVTILITALSNLLPKNRFSASWQYSMALGFGFVHGMGFSGFIRAMLGREQALWKPLLSFNLGVEIGQLIFVAGILLVNWLLLRLYLKMKWWTVGISVLAASLSILMIYDRI